MVENHRFLDYEKYHELRSQDRRDFREGSGFKFLSEACGLFQQAASRFQLAGACMGEVERDLNSLIEKVNKFNRLDERPVNFEYPGKFN